MSPQAGRITSVDLFRGGVILTMVLVNNPGSWQHVLSPLRHAAWHGFTIADFVFPAFLWTAGISVFLSEHRRSVLGRPPKAILPRFLILFGLGLVLHLIPAFDFQHVRIPGVLQRIAVCSAIVTLIGRARSAAWEAGALITALVLYLGVMLSVRSIGGAWERGTNVAGAVDNFLLSGHLWSYTKTWDPEGIVSTLPAIATTLIGSLCARWLLLPRRKASVIFAVSGLALTVCAVAAAHVIPVNKNLWTPSYVFLSAGICSAIFGVLHEFFFKASLLEAMGQNALTLYIGSGVLAKALQLFSWQGAPAKQVIVNTLFDWPWPAIGSLGFALLFTSVAAAAGHLLLRAGWRLHV